MSPPTRRSGPHRQEGAAVNENTTTTFMVAEADDYLRDLSPWERRELRALLDGRRPVFRDPRRELRFRRDQAGWHRRVEAARRLAAIDDLGVVDPLLKWWPW